MKKISIKIFINIVLIIIFIVCSFRIAYQYFQYNKDGKSYSKVQILKPKLDETNKKDSNEDKLKKINPDYKLWITIPDTNINYPVVQCKDNEFYLHNNFYKEKSISGTIFMDYRNNIDIDKNIIIYGHNMKNGTMFSAINDFKEKNNFHKGIIKIFRENKEYTYEVFSVFITDSNHMEFKTRFDSNEDYNTYIKNLKDKSMYSKNINFQDNNDIITLYTCSYEFDGARTIVCAILR